jgi:hypothetical protein
MALFHLADWLFPGAHTCTARPRLAASVRATPRVVVRFFRSYLDLALRRQYLALPCTPADGQNPSRATFLQKAPSSQSLGSEPYEDKVAGKRNWYLGMPICCLRLSGSTGRRTGGSGVGVPGRQGRIIRAYNGAEGHFINATEALRGVNEGRLYLRVENYTMGGDPPARTPQMDTRPLLG